MFFLLNYDNYNIIIDHLMIVNIGSTNKVKIDAVTTVLNEIQKHLTKKSIVQS